MQCPERLEKLVVPPVLPFSVRETLSSKKFPLGAYQCQHGRLDGTAKKKKHGYSHVFVCFPIVLLKFLEWTPELT